MNILHAIREAGRVQRAHVIPHQGSYNVAEHSYNALCILFSLYKKIENTLPSYNLIQAVMYHDIPERWTGDIPAPVKWYSPKLKKELDRIEDKIFQKFGMSRIFNELTPYEKDWLRFVDLLELYTWCWEQTVAGNGLNVQDTASRVAVVLRDMQGLFPDWAVEYLKTLKSTRFAEIDELLYGGTNERK